jgi:YbbR domain-containing protein
MALFPGVFTKNWRLKVLALAVAVLLWTVPRFEAQTTEVLDDIPVLVDLIDPEWAHVADSSPATVSVTLSGPTRDLIAIGVNRPPVYVPMTDVLDSDTVVLLEHAWFRGANQEGVVVEDLRPGSVILRFERVVRQSIPLQLQLDGELPEGISLAGSPVITPSSAVVSGPASGFEGVDSIRLTPMDLSLVVGSGSFIQPVDTAGFPELEILTREASVEFLTDSTTIREFPDQRLVLPDLSSEPQLQAPPASFAVVLSGAPSLVEAVAPESLTVSIPDSEASLAPGEEKAVLVVVEGVPEFVSYSVTPEWVLLRRPVGR